MIDIRRIFTHVEQIHHEFGPVADTPLLRGAIGVVLTNPFAGRYEPDLLPMMNALQPLGIDLAERLRAAMGVPAQSIEGYGKGAIVGAAGEQEHGAMWHVPGGYAMRELLGWKGDRQAYAKGQGEAKTGQPGNALAIVSSTKKSAPTAPRSMCRSRTSTPAMCAATLTPSRCAFPARHWPTKSFLFWP